MSGQAQRQRSRSSSGRRPLASILLLSALWIAFRLDDATRLRRGIGLEPLPARWVFDGAHPKPWQFVTYAFVHGFGWHLYINMLALLPFSLMVERRLGPGRTLASFVALAAMVSAGFSLLDSRDLYGASGVVAGFVTMAATIWGLASEVVAWKRGLPSVLAAGYLAATELYPALQGHPNPGWKPHVVGALAGIVLGSVVRGRTAPLQ